IVSKANAPQPVDSDVVSAILQPTCGSELAIRSLAERIDETVTEITHEETAAELSEIVGRHRDAPRRVERAMRCDPSQQLAARTELADEAVTNTGFVINASAFCICDED